MRFFNFFLAKLCLFLTALPCPAAELTDSDDKRITFEKPFARIISLYPAHTENLIALGCEDRVVAVGGGDPLKDKRPALRFQDDPERLLALKPDLVLIRPMISRAYPNLVQRLEENGVTVVSLQPVTQEDLDAYWLALGRLTGREDAAREMTANFRRRVAELRAKAEAIPKDKRPRVYFESIHRRMKTFAPDSMAMFVLETAGGVNAAPDAPQVRETNIAAYGKERLLARAEAIDVYLAQKGRMNPVTVEEILAEPGFEAIKAIREKQVFLVDEALVSRPTPGLIAGIEAIRRILYPEVEPAKQP